MKPNVECVTKAAKNFFPNFEMAKITTPLRLTENVSKEVQRLASIIKKDVPNNVLVAKSTPPSNIAEGRPVIRLQGKHILHCLKEALVLTQGLKVMVVIPCDTETIREEYGVIGFFPLLRDCMKKLGKEIIYLTERKQCCSPFEDIQSWISEEIDKIMITTAPYIKGFECEAIVDFTSFEEPEIFSRAACQIVKAPRDSLVTQLDNFKQFQEVIGMSLYLDCTLTKFLNISQSSKSDFPFHWIGQSRCLF